MDYIEINENLVEKESTTNDAKSNKVVNDIEPIDWDDM